MKTSYFTFGQVHVHSVNGITFDKDCVVKITSLNPRQVMFDTFGPKWCWEHDTQPPLRLYPRGIIELS